MFQALLNVFRIPELRNKILFTLGLLAVYRIGFWIPIPGVNEHEMARQFQRATQGQGGLTQLISFVSIFGGGSIKRSTIFGLGIMPYISASIISQLIASVSPPLKKLQEEGPTGRQKINEWTRYATVFLCIFQSITFLGYLKSKPDLVYAGMSESPLWWAMAVTSMTAGTIFLMR